MRKTRLLWLLLFVLSAGAYRGMAQQGSYRLSHLSIKEGLSENSVRCLIQDKSGFIWLGTLDGLNKYNGYDFEIFRHNPKDSLSLCSNSINALLEDRNGNIWIGTQYGLSRFEREEGKFINYFADEQKHKSLSANNVQAIFEDRNQQIWILTTESLDRYVPGEDRFEHFNYTSEGFRQSGEYYFYDIRQDKEGAIWFGNDQGLFRLKPQENVVKTIYSTANPLAGGISGMVRTLYIHHDDRLYIGTTEGLFRYNKRSGEVEAINLGHPNLQNSACPINKIMGEDNDHLLLVTNMGVYRLALPSLKVRDAFPGHSVFPDLRAADAMIDFSGIYWIGTFEEGLYKLVPNRKKFMLVSNQTHPGLSSNLIASVYRDKDERLWIGTWGDGLNILTDEGIKIIGQEPGGPKLSNGYVHAIYQTSDGTIWLGTRDGPMRYEPGEDRFVPLRRYDLDFFEAELRNTRIFNIYEDHLKRIWFTSNKGLFYLHNDSLQQFHNENIIIRGNLFYTIKEDFNNKLWLGTEYGLYQLDAESLEVLRHFTTSGKQKQISNNSVLDITIAADSSMWVGTKAGLNHLSQSGGMIEYFTQSDVDFNNDYIYSIVEDKHRKLWLATNRGIIKFDPKAQKATNYYQSDGLQGYEYNYGAVYKDKQGQIYFGGTEGLNYFYPDSIQRNPHKPKIVFSKLQRYLKHEMEVENIDTKEEIVIDNQVYGFNIEFFALEYSRPNRNRYAYKVSGIFDTWTYLGTRHTVSFPRMSPGHYVLHVKASNDDLVWNEEGRTLHIIVKPSWFANAVAYTIYVIIVVVLIVLVFRLRTQKLRESRRALQKREDASQQIRMQKEELALIHKNTTASITYARRIIEAMMPSIKTFRDILPESFVLFMPKDIVSGDFYWILKQKNKIFLAAVDCTGHGIPGAFMSIIGFDLLRNIIEINRVDEPAEIISQLDEGVKQTFSAGEHATLHDGMDLSLVVIDQEKGYLEFAGAMNPLYLVRDNKIITLDGDRLSVGSKREPDQDKEFTNHRIPVRQDDVVYLFSDGLPDQFGGPKGKKFKYRRFRHLLLTVHKLPFDKQKTTLQDSIYKWMGDLEQIDDILLIGAKPLGRNNK